VRSVAAAHSLCWLGRYLKRSFLNTPCTQPLWNVMTYILVKLQHHTNYTLEAKCLQLKCVSEVLLMQQFSGTADIAFTSINVRSNYKYVEFLGAFTKLWKVATTFVPSAWNNSAPNGKIFIKTYIWVLFWKLAQKIQVSLKSGKINKHLTWRPTYIYDSISLIPPQNEKCFRWKLESCRENQNTNFVFSNTFLKNTPFKRKCGKNGTAT
jgi:hypothetical protein